MSTKGGQDEVKKIVSTAMPLLEQVDSADNSNTHIQAQELSLLWCQGPLHQKQA